MSFLKHSFTLAAIALCYCAFAGFELLRSTGQVGTTRKGGFATGCACHGFAPVESVIVRIEGPAKVQPGSLTTFTVVMTGGPSVAGGLNVAAAIGDLHAIDPATQLMFSGGTNSYELTHTTPKLFNDDTVRWQFNYEAPSIPTIDTIFSVGNSIDLNGNTFGDAWNLGEDFYVDVTEDSSLDVGDETVPLSFQLNQNFPNPFNPRTEFSFEISEFGYTTLRIYDPLGRVVATVVAEEMGPGKHRGVWDASGSSAGVYFYCLQSGPRSAVRKMVLLK